MMNAEITKQMPFLTRDFLCKYGIHVTQQEFDALIFHRYLNYRLNDNIQKLLKEGNRNRDDWKWAFMNGISKTSGFYEGWLNRTLDELELFFDGDYKRNH